ncbi:MAG TPA: FimV/HubP family polar landmark protein [Luteimonas sp.]|nr:FimV/HubP family polar landmark protein [Luteimonas sp.]
MIAWVLVLALLAGPASALGLGPIEVRSQRDQPLLAEIQVISSDPSELDRLQARLASPETFARIGLQPPQGIVSDLQFALALDAAGRPVIRVTSVAPVQQSLLTFLVEVDWGQGRLVREYSALVDAPRTVAAPSQPPIQAPVLQPSNTIVRPAESVATAEPTPEPTPSTETGATPAAAPGTERSAESTADPDAIAPSPQATPAQAPARPVAAGARDAAGEYGPVKAGDTLGAIAGGVRAEGETLEQAMVALLRANPEAFIAGNINLVRQGAVLRIPAGAERSEYSAAEAAAVVRAQVGEWRDMRRPVQQPDAVSAAAAAPAPAPVSTATTPATPTRAVRDTPRAAGARLEIVPPSQGSGQRAGTRSGIDAGGEGDMLRQELLQKDEALAARGAEVEELKARVADLERLQAQQQQLIQLKDSELAAAQQRLAATNAQPVPAVAASSAQPTPASDTRAGGDASLLVWVGSALVLAALLAWWVLRRRTRTRPATPVFDTAALAAAVPPRTGEPTTDGERPQAMPAGGLRDRVRGTPPPTVVPTWHAEADAPTAGAVGHGAGATLQTRSPDPVMASGRPAREAPRQLTGGVPTGAPAAAAPASAASAAAASPAAAPGPDRLELARAYLDLGDTETARGLLVEVAAGDDPFAREDAARMLRDLG